MSEPKAAPEQQDVPAEEQAEGQPQQRPPGDQMYRTDAYHDQDGRFIQVDRPTDDDGQPLNEGVEYIGHGQFQGRAPNGQMQKCNIRFEIPAGTLKEAFGQIDEAFQKAVEGAQQQQRRVVVAGVGAPHPKGMPASMRGMFDPTGRGRKRPC